MDEEGCDEVIPFFILFGWKSALNVSDERQEKWDKSISKNKLIPLC
jgi:hypothetical protein